MHPVQFGFEKSIQNLILSERFSKKCRPNASNIIRFYAVFDFSRLVYGFIWI